MKNAAVTVVALALALAACDKGAEADTAATGTVAAPEPAAAARSGGDAVQAVLQSTGDPVAKLHFVLESRPVAGKAFPLQLHVSAPVPVAELQFAAESPDLIIAPASATLVLAEANTTVVQEVVVTAPREGLVDLHVRLKGADAPETVYAVPILVAAGAAP